MEVLIGMALISLAIVPLVLPLVQMVKRENQYLRELEEYRKIPYLFASDLQRLYENSISWSAIEEGLWAELESGVSRRIHRIRSKPKGGEEAEKYHVLQLHYRGPSWERRYHVFVERVE